MRQTFNPSRSPIRLDIFGSWGVRSASSRLWADLPSRMRQKQRLPESERVNTMATLKQLIKPEDLARKLDVTTDTLLSWREKGMPWVKAGKSVFILEGPFMKWMGKNLQNGGSL